MLATTTRNATLNDLAQLLTQQDARKLDVVAHASQVTALPNGNIRIAGTEPVLDDDGVTMTAGEYRPTSVFESGVAAKLDIPSRYLRRMRTDRPDLWAGNINGWMHGSRVRRTADGATSQQYPGDDRRFLLRCFKGDDGQPGIARAFLSDSYKAIDNLDVLLAAMDGVRAAGVEVDVHSCDLTDNRMHVRMHAPQIAAMAPTLLRGYRSPFTGESGTDNPVVFAGLRIGNSETGGGAFSIAPELRVLVCKNGMTMNVDAIRSVHLGGKLEEGIIRWSDATQMQAKELVKSKTADAVRTFLDADYLQSAITRLERRAGEEVRNVEEVQVLARSQGVSQAEVDGMLEFFVKGGQMTRGGVANALTAYSQTLDDADAAAELDVKAVRLLV